MNIVFTNVKNLTREQERHIACHCSNRTKSTFRATYLYTKYYNPDTEYFMAILYDEKGTMIGWAAAGIDVRYKKLSVQTYVKERFRKKGHSTRLIQELFKKYKITRRRKVGCYSPIVLKSLTKLGYKGYVFK